MNQKKIRFNDLQQKWYAKLKKSGYEDIEDTSNPERPLKEWHGLKSKSQRSQLLKENREKYQREIDNFINHKSFHEACKSMATHGNCKFTMEEIIVVWSYHVEGITFREIGKRLQRSTSRVFYIVKGLREWMNLL